MSKYDALGKFLAEQKNQYITMTFAEMERVVGYRLPQSAKYPAWWSNNPSNNVMTTIWLNAGFKTEQVDIAGKKLVFRRVSLPAPQAKTVSSGASAKSPDGAFAEAPRPYIAGTARPPIFGALKGLIKVVSGADLTHPADTDWGKAS